MARRKTLPEEIRNPENYFNRYIAKEVLNDHRETKQYYDFFVSLDALSDGESHETQIPRSLTIDFESDLACHSESNWIDYFERPWLQKAVSSFSESEKRLLKLRFLYGLSQRETAEVIGINQSNVCRQEVILLRKIKDWYFKTHDTP